MSSQCNHCKVKAVKRRAGERGLKVTTMKNDEWGMGGVNMYMHPADVKLPKDMPGDGDMHDKYFVAWFMAIGKTCEC